MHTKQKAMKSSRALRRLGKILQYDITDPRLLFPLPLLKSRSHMRSKRYLLLNTAIHTTPKEITAIYTAARNSGLLDGQDIITSLD